MSLINDALKRAKANQSNAPAPDLQFRPVEPLPTQSTGGHKSSWLFTTVVVIACLFGLVFSAQNLMRKGEPQEVRAAPLPDAATTASAAAPASVPPAAIPSKDPATSLRSTPPATPSVPPATTQKRVAAPAAASTTSQPRSATTTPTIPSRTAPPTPAQAPPPASTAPVEDAIAGPMPRVQAIVMHPTKPSAIIGGRSLFIGDRFGDLRVSAITRDNVTLVNGTQKVVLTLE